jgi:hypothetical protein
VTAANSSCQEKRPHKHRNWALKQDMIRGFDLIARETSFWARPLFLLQLYATLNPVMHSHPHDNAIFNRILHFQIIII